MILACTIIYAEQNYFPIAAESGSAQRADGASRRKEGGKAVDYLHYQLSGYKIKAISIIR